MDQRLSMVTLGVSDMARAKSFYLAGLGWTEVDHPSESVCFIQLPSIVLGLYGWAKLAEDMELNLVSPSTGFRGFALAYNTASKAETDGHPWEVAFNPYTLPSPDGSFVMNRT